MTEEPAWLVAWRQKAPTAPAQPSTQPQAAPRQGGSTPKAKRGLPPPLLSAGFREPRFEAWKFDGCKRREPVLDLDHTPPRVVRKVGWRVCMKCASPFWSVDVIRVRMCETCKLPPPGHRGRNGRKRTS